MKKLIAMLLFLSLGVFAAESPITIVPVDKALASDVDMTGNAVRIRTTRREGGAVFHGWGSGGGFDGTEFGLKGKNYIVTAAHVILDDHKKLETEIHVEILDTAGNRAWVKATVEYYDEELDIAILKTKSEMQSVAQFAPNDSLKVGDEVVAIGGPLGEELQESRGKVTKKSEWKCDMVGTMLIRHGNSGGPVFDANGRMVAVIRAFIPVEGRDQMAGGMGVMVPIECVRKFINSKK